MQMNRKKLSLIYLAAGALSWLLTREITASLWVWLDLGFGNTWLVPIYDFIGIAVGLLLFVFLIFNKKVNDYVEDVISELAKVTWPNRKETVLSTGIVAVLVGICSLLLFGFDAMWGFFVKVFYQ